MEKNIYKESREKTKDVRGNKLSQETVAGMIGVSRSTLVKYEDDLKDDIPSPGAVLQMSKIFKDPGLRRRHCTQQCPIGKKDFSKVEAEKTLFQTGYGLIKANQELLEFKNELFEILDDGVVSSTETKRLIEMKPTINKVQKLLDEIEIAILKCAENNGES